MLHNKSMFVILVIVQLFVLQSYDSYSFLIGYTTMVFVIIVLNTISTDDYYKSSSFLMTMPIKRETYVMEKYILMLGFSFLGAMFCMILCILLHPEMMLVLLLEGIGIYTVLALSQLLMLPIHLKFGNEKGRIVLLSLLGCVAVVVSSYYEKLPDAFGLQGSIGNLIRNAVTGFFSLPAGLITLIVLCIFAVCLVISYCASLRIMRRKEF